ncbi:MAG: flagellar export protein FliJ [Acidobacteriota bacterium]
MKQNNFKKVIQVRTIQQKQAQQQVAEAVRTRLEEEERLSEFQKHRTAAAGELRTTQKMSVAQMQIMRSHLEALSQQIESQESAVARASEHEDKKREALLKKSQEKKMVEVLHEKRLKSEQKESDRREQKALDEYAQRLR